jgi:polyhydroxybutyrate depolymerase
MMTYRLGVELSDIFAAVAPVAGTIGGHATENSPLWIISEPDYPVSVCTVHGKLDENVPYDGGHGSQTSGTRIDLSVNESIAFWVEQNECDPVPEMNVSGNISIKTYHNGLAGTEVMLVTILNGEHWWPGAPQDPYQEILATDVIWEFFENHPKH